MPAPASSVSARAEHRVSPSPKPVSISIIVPTLNEADTVCRLAPALLRLPGAEIIFADGGSRDGTTRAIAKHCRGEGRIRLIHAPCGRAGQMNAGAKAATGEWLIFLHADTSLPLTSFQGFRRFVATHQHVVAGAFAFRVAHPRWVYRYLEFYVGVRSRLLKLPYGDQALFVKRPVFEEIGGYRHDYPLMEDVELVRRLNKRRGFVILEFPVYTSARRFEQDGYLRRTCGNLYLQLLYALGVQPQRLALRYWKIDARK